VKRAFVGREDELCGAHRVGSDPAAIVLGRWVDDGSSWLQWIAGREPTKLGKQSSSVVHRCAHAASGVCARQIDNPVVGTRDSPQSAVDAWAPCCSRWRTELRQQPRRLRHDTRCSVRLMPVWRSGSLLAAAMNPLSSTAANAAC
jgi:hypothetical protein